MTPAAIAPDLPARVRTALQEEWPGADLIEMHPLASGASGVTLRGLVRAAGTDRRIVVKTIPAGLAPTRNRDLARQVRVLEQLRTGSAVPVPAVIAFDAGEPPVRPPLYVMGLVEGTTVDPTSPGSAPGRRCAPKIMTARAHAAMRTLVDLHATEVVALGEPVVVLADEVTRWDRALATTSGPHRQLADALLARLRATMPDELAPTLVHGDYRLGNLLFRTVVPVAVLDWEIWSVADPRLDLGWFLARAVCGHPSAPDGALGFPAAADLLATYTRGAPDPPDLAWFLALAAVKHAAASALIDKRSAGSPGRDPGRIGRLLSWAQRQLGGHEEEIHRA